MKENFRKSINDFLKLYFVSCQQVYDEIGFDKLPNKQFKFLKSIYKDDNMTFTKLAEKFKLSKPTITEIISRFIDNDLVYKENSIEDKRVYYLRLTDKGKLLATSNELESKKFMHNILKKISEEEAQILTEIFFRFGMEDKS